MDFIERWLGLSPDGGDGSIEAMFLFAAAAVMLAFFLRYRSRLRIIRLVRRRRS
jgi:hypothetical protein